MPRRATALALLAPLALVSCAMREEAPRRTAAHPAPQLAFPLPAPGRLAARAETLKGPRVMTETAHGRALTMYGSTSSGSRLLIAGCSNARRCAGTDVVHTAMAGCPPTDAELWYFATLDPRGTDLDATPGHPGAAAWRQAVADLRPRIAITFRRGPKSVVRGTARGGTRTARRFARLAELPYDRGPVAQGLASWTATARPGTAAISVELPASRISARKAVRIAYAVDRLAGTRFALGGLQERRNMIRHGRDPREYWH